MDVGIAVAGLHHDVQSRPAAMGLADELETFETGKSTQIEIDTECVVITELEDGRRLLELFGTSDPATATGEYRREQLSGRRIVVDDQEALWRLREGRLPGSCHDLSQARCQLEPAGFLLFKSLQLLNLFDSDPQPPKASPVRFPESVRSLDRSHFAPVHASGQ